MLDSLRNTANSWLMKIFLGILLVSFAFGGGVLAIQEGLPRIFGGQSRSQLITSGKSAITPQAYEYTLINTVQRVGSRLTQEQLGSLNIPQRVLMQMSTDVVLDEEARLMKIGVSETGIASILAQDSFFHNQAGQFDKSMFLGYLQQTGIKQQDVFAAIGRQAQRRQIIIPVISDVQAPDTLASAYFLHQNEARSIDYIKLTPQTIGNIPDPDDKTLAGWYEKNKALFNAPEYRRITWLRMNTNDIARPQDVSDDDIKTFYEQHKGQYGTEKPLDTVRDEIRNRIAEEKAEALLRDNQKKIEDERFEGATLQELAPRYNLPFRQVTIDMNGQMPDGKPADLPEAALLIPEVFKSAEGVETDPISYNSGYLWYHVDKITPPRERPLAEMRGQVLAAWKQEETQRLLDEKAVAIKKALDEGKTIGKIAAGNKVKQATEQGLRRDSNNKKLGAETVQAAFSGQQGATGIAYSEDGQSRIIFKVTQITFPADSNAQSLPSQERDALSGQLAQDFVNELLFSARKQHPVQVNTALYNDMLQQYGNLLRQ